MKKKYANLEYEVVRFDEEDVITASGNPCECDDVKVLTPICPDGVEVVCPCKGINECFICNCISVEK